MRTSCRCSPFTLARLYQEYGADGELSLAEYEALGGLSGAIEAAVDGVLSEAKSERGLPADEEALLGLLKSAFIPHLVRLTDSNEFARRVSDMSVLPPPAAPLIDLLVDRHLLVRKASAEGRDATIEVAHEALLREWPQLVEWLDGERSFMAWRRRVEDARRQWEEAPDWEKRDALLIGRALTVAQTWQSSRAADLTDAESSFIAASVEAAAAEERRLKEQAEEARRAGHMTRRARIAIVASALSVIGVTAGAIALFGSSPPDRGAAVLVGPTEVRLADGKTSVVDANGVPTEKARELGLTHLIGANRNDPGGLASSSEDGKIDSRKAGPRYVDHRPVVSEDGPSNASPLSWQGFPESIEPVCG